MQIVTKNMFKHQLARALSDEVAKMEEFANGAAQVTVRTKDGAIHREVLITNSTCIAAMRGFTELPFKVEDIAQVYQTEADKNPSKRDGWQFWDKWK